MRNKAKERETPEVRKETQPSSRINFITAVGGIIIGAAVIAAGIETLFKGPDSLGVALLLGGVVVAGAPILNAFRSRNR